MACMHGAEVQVWHLGSFCLQPAPAISATFIAAFSIHSAHETAASSQASLIAECQLIEMVCICNSEV